MVAIVITDTHDSASNHLLYEGFNPNPNFTKALENQKIYHAFFEGSSFDKKIGDVNTYNLEYRTDDAKAYKVLTGLLALKAFSGDPATYNMIKESMVADLKDHYQTEIPASLSPGEEIDFIYNLLKTKVPKIVFDEFETDWKGDLGAGINKYFKKRDEEMTRVASEFMQRHPGESFVVIVGGMHEHAFKHIQDISLKTINAQAVYQELQDQQDSGQKFYSRLFSIL
jgi:hypothetical protein